MAEVSFSFDGEVCVVTGASSGLGAAIARQLAQAGARVASIDLAPGDAPSEAAERAYACDVTDPAAVGRTFAGIADDFGPLDHLVNSAGIGPGADVQGRFAAKLRAIREGGDVLVGGTAALDDGAWRRMLSVHADGVFHCTRAALRQMEARRAGAIVNLSAVSGLTGLPAAPHYAAAKGAIDAFTKSVAKEVAPLGIRVNSVAPGFIRTPMVVDGVEADMLVRYAGAIPLGRLGEPEEVASVVLFLCSKQSSYLTGQVVSPNGGLWT